MIKLPFPFLMEELCAFGDPQGKTVYNQYKAERVYAKCMAKGKEEIAKRIKAKYRFPQDDDLTISLSIALFANK